MTLQKSFGTKDLNLKDVQLNQLINNKLSNLYKMWGYEEITPPKVERLETLMAGGSISTNDIVKLVADEPFGLRPEMTASIARASTTRLAHKKRPIRLWSTGTVFKSKNDCDGKYIIEENINSGVELIGNPGMESELELLYMLLECLNSLEIGLRMEPVLLIGHTTIFNLLTKDIKDLDKKKIQDCLSEFNLIGLNSLNINKNIKDILINILKTRGQPKMVLETLESVYGQNDIFEKLKRLFSIIVPISEKHGVSIQLDPTYQSHFNLYNGLIFQLICKNSYSPKIIARGGRYDSIFNMFGTDQSNETGAGFSFSIDKLRELLKDQEYNGLEPEKVLVAYGINKRYEDALEKQLEIQAKGCIAMVELKPCTSQEQASNLMKKRGFSRIEWIS